MLCEKCQKNHATVHMQQFIHGVKKEMHLCQECSFKLDMPFSLENIFQGFLEQINPLMSQAAEPVKKKSMPCERCGMTYEEFRKGGKLGCDTCYKTFLGAITALFKNVQGSTRHNGKFPQRTGMLIKQKRQEDELRIRLKKAVEEENFEEAAKLRDEIRALEVKS